MAMPSFAGGRCADHTRHSGHRDFVGEELPDAKLTPFALVEGTAITYPSDQASLL